MMNDDLIAKVSALTERTSALVGRRDLSQAEFSSWLGGAVDGGPRNDGYYPLTDGSGFTRLVPSPARQVADGGQSGSNGTAFSFLVADLGLTATPVPPGQQVIPQGTFAIINLTKTTDVLGNFDDDRHAFIAPDTGNYLVTVNSRMVDDSPPMSIASRLIINDLVDTNTVTWQGYTGGRTGMAVSHMRRFERGDVVQLSMQGRRLPGDTTTPALAIAKVRMAVTRLAEASGIGSGLSVAAEPAPFAYAAAKHRRKLIQAKFAGVVTLPATASVGDVFYVLQMETQPVQFAPGPGARLECSTGETSSGGQYSLVQLTVGQNDSGTAALWVLSGQTGPIWPDRLEWDGVSNFTHGPGLNWAEMGFDRYRPWISPIAAKGLWDAFVGFVDSAGEDRWQRAAGAGCDVIRIAIDPQKFMETDGSDAALAPWVDVVKHCTDDVLAHGMKVIIDMHVAAGGDAGQYGDAPIRAGFLENNEIWRKAKASWVAIGRMLNHYRTDQVAFEIYNETEEFSGEQYIPMVSALHHHIRSVTGPRTKHIVGSPFYASHNGFENRNFKRSQFGPNTGFATHAAYYPNLFTHQGINGQNPFQYLHRLEFFADPAKKDATIANFRADAAAGGATQGDIDGGVAALEDYYNNWTQQIGFDGVNQFATAYPMNALWGQPDGSDPGTSMGRWMFENNVDGVDMHPTEAGAHRDFDDVGSNIGGSTEAVARHISLINRYATKVRKMNGLVLWNDETKHFSVSQNIAPAGAEPDYTGPLEPLIMIAAGMKGKWTPSLLGDRLDQWLDPLDQDSVVYDPETALVSQINDKSGNGNHETQPDVEFRPTLMSGMLVFGHGIHMFSPLSAGERTEWIFQVLLATPEVVKAPMTIIGASDAGGRLLRLDNLSGNISTIYQGSVYKSGFQYSLPAGAPCLMGVQYGLSGHPNPPADDLDFSQRHKYHFNAGESYDLYPSLSPPLPEGQTSITGAQAGGKEPIAARMGGRLRGHGELSSVEIEQIKLFLMNRYGIA